MLHCTVVLLVLSLVRKLLPEHLSYIPKGVYYDTDISLHSYVHITLN